MNKLKEFYKEDGKIIAAITSVIAVCLAAILGLRNLMIYLGPSECYEYLSLKEILIMVGLILLCGVFVLVFPIAIALVFYPFDKLLRVTGIYKYFSGKLKKWLTPKPLTDEEYLALQEKRQKRLNNPNWFKRNEAAVMGTIITVILSGFLIFCIVEIVKFWYCI